MAKSEAKQKFANSFLIAKMAKWPADTTNNHSTQITRFISFSYAQQKENRKANF